jgi:hypothetical protein
MRAKNWSYEETTEEYAIEFIFGKKKNNLFVLWLNYPKPSWIPVTQVQHLGIYKEWKDSWNKKEISTSTLSTSTWSKSSLIVEESEENESECEEESDVEVSEKGKNEKKDSEELSCGEESLEERSDSELDEQEKSGQERKKIFHWKTIETLKKEVEQKKIEDDSEKDKEDTRIVKKRRKSESVKQSEQGVRERSKK